MNATNKTSGNRAKKTGKYTYSTDFDRVCVCGRTLGVHDGDAPHGFGDLSLDPREGLPECEAFKPAKAVKP